jgi:hypothetical protein
MARVAEGAAPSSPSEAARGGRGGDGSFGSGGAGGGVGPNAVDGGSGGHGGFGGGAGGRAQGDSASAGIAGAFGGEAGHGGGGGAGLGGAVFVSDSAAAVFTACEFLDNAASGGAGGAGEGGGDSGSAGLGKGGAIFLLETASVGASGSRFLRNSASDALSSATDNPHAYGSGVEIFPLVESIDPVGFARSNQTSVQFLVRFNKPVAEVDVDDFALDTPLASASLDAVNPANSRRIIPVAFDTEYIAEISHGGGISSIRLDALPSATIFDADGAPLSEGYDAGQTLEIDTVPPVVAEIGSQSFNPTNAGAFTFFGVYSEPVSGLTFEAVTATTTGTLMGAGHGGSTFIPGALGSGVCFGGGSRFETASAVDIPGDGSFSFDGWITRFFDGIPAWGIGQAPDAPGSGFYAGYRSDSRFVFSFGGSDLVTEQAFPGDNAFGHWAGTYNAATGERILYLDGVQIARDIAPADFVSGGALQSGAVDGPLGGQSVGEIDEMRVWARVLDPSELENLGLASLVGDEADLVAYWHFDDVQNIDGAQAFANDFPDYGPNGHPLLGNEFASWGASNNPRRLFFLSTVETGTGSGFMSIDVADLDTVRDAAGNPLGGPGVGNGDFVDGVEIEIDRATPVAQSLVVEDGRSVVVAFDETLSNPSLLVSRFALSGTGKGTLATNPASATQFAPGQVRLTWSAGSMTAGGDLTITIGLVRDIVGNQMAQNGTDNVVTLVGGGVAFDGYGGMLVR